MLRFLRVLLLIGFAVTLAYSSWHTKELTRRRPVAPSVTYSHPKDAHGTTVFLSDSDVQADRLNVLLMAATVTGYAVLYGLDKKRGPI